MIIIKKKEEPEFVGQIIDVFEDYLTLKKTFSINKSFTDVIFRGDDYDTVASSIREVLNRWRYRKIHN